jgi:hypothetical protein
VRVEPLRAKERPDTPARDPGVEDATKDDDHHGRHRIRCPLCMWVPKASSRWQCYCGHSWNTFDTGGTCPTCDFRYEQTMCLACHRWSKHRAWYADEPSPS